MAKVIPISHRLPWLDRSGNFSSMKAGTLLLLAMPALWLLYRTVFLGLGPRPLTEATHRVGDWTVYLLLVTLAVTPARRLFQWPRLIQLRRMIGVAALFYILFHFLLFFVDSRWNLFFVGKEIVLRFYLTIGFTAILMLSALGLTSFDSMIKRLGASRWNRLHLLIYPATFIGILHYFLQSKSDVTQPVIMAGLFFWLMGYRIMARFGKKQGLVPFLSLSILVAILTAGVEVAWYGLMTGIGAERVFWANFQFDYRVSAAWWILAAGLAVTICAEIRRRQAAFSRPDIAPSPA
jgi:sulfoxide reductase heme-binding subunit YedZ